MGKQRKIGVLTFHKCINYGSYWQARCLVESLRERGHDAVLLDHDSPQVKRAELRCSFQPALPQRTNRKHFPAYKAKVRRFHDAFDALPTTGPFPIDRPSAAGSFDTVIVGSDEVWNFCHPWYANQPIFFGEGLKADRLVSYAASCGNHDADRGIERRHTDRIRRFDALSVRDSNSHRLLEPAVGRKIEIVLDPCLQFADRIGEPAANGRDYAIVYGHSFPEWLQAAARAWSRRTGMPLVSVGYANDWTDEQRIDAGPAEFAALMAGARAVVTNFFHGCVFSLVKEKPFVAAPTEYRSNKIRDLLEQLDAGPRLVDEASGETAVGELLDSPPRQQVHERIRDWRHRSEAFLDAALA